MIIRFISLVNRARITLSSTKLMLLRVGFQRTSAEFGRVYIGAGLSNER